MIASSQRALFNDQSGKIVSSLILNSSILLNRLSYMRQIRHAIK